MQSTVQAQEEQYIRLYEADAFLTAAQTQQKIYWFYVKISSVKVCNSLLTSIEEATGINQYFADPDLVRL